jgi:hypothetical protein
MAIQAWHTYLGSFSHSPLQILSRIKTGGGLRREEKVEKWFLELEAEA